MSHRRLAWCISLWTVFGVNSNKQVCFCVRACPCACVCCRGIKCQHWSWAVRAVPLLCLLPTSPLRTTVRPFLTQSPTSLPRQTGNTLVCTLDPTRCSEPYFLIAFWRGQLCQSASTYLLTTLFFLCSGDEVRLDREKILRALLMTELWDQDPLAFKLMNPRYICPSASHI